MNGSGELVLTLSSGGTINAGSVVGGGGGALGALTPRLRTSSTSVTLASLNLHFAGHLEAGWSLVSDNGYAMRLKPRVGNPIGITVAQNNVWYTGLNCTGTPYGFENEVAPGEVAASGNGATIYVPRTASLESVTLNSWLQPSGSCSNLTYAAPAVYRYLSNSSAVTGFNQTSATNYWITFEP